MVQTFFFLLLLVFKPLPRRLVQSRGGSCTSANTIYTLRHNVTISVIPVLQREAGRNERRLLRDKWSGHWVISFTSALKKICVLMEFSMGVLSLWYIHGVSCEPLFLHHSLIFFYHLHTLFLINLSACFCTCVSCYISLTGSYSYFLSWWKPISNLSHFHPDNIITWATLETECHRQQQQEW